MRAPSPRRELVTKADLKAELERFPTRAELQAELARFPTKAELQAELERFATKADLESRTRSLMIGIESVSSEANVRSDRLEAEIARRPTHEDLARAVNTIIEAIRSEIRGLDDKYSDLPERVTRLEAADLPARVARLEAARRRR